MSLLTLKHVNNCGDCPTMNIFTKGKLSNEMKAV